MRSLRGPDYLAVKNENNAKQTNEIAIFGEEGFMDAKVNSTADGFIRYSC